MSSSVYSDSDNLIVLQQVASNSWNILWQKIYYEANDLTLDEPDIKPENVSEYDLSTLRVRYSPTPVEIFVLQIPSMWSKFENELMKGTKVRWEAGVTGQWFIIIEYIPDYPEVDTCSNYHKYSLASAILAVRFAAKSELADKLQKCQLSDIRQNIIYLDNYRDLELLDELVKERNTFNLPDLRGYAKLSDSNYWIKWDGDTRVIPCSKTSSVCCVVC